MVPNSPTEGRRPTLDPGTPSWSWIPIQKPNPRSSQRAPFLIIVTVCTILAIWNLKSYGNPQELHRGSNVLGAASSLTKTDPCNCDFEDPAEEAASHQAGDSR